MRKLLTILFLSLPLLVSSQGSEMINNGTFESSANWTVSFGGWSISGGMANFLDDVNQPIDQLSDDMVSPTAPNTEYVLKVHVSNCDRYPYTDQAYFTVLSTSGVIYVQGGYYREDKTYTLIFTTPANIGDGGIRFFGYNFGGTYSLDSISLKTTASVGASPYYIDPDGDDSHAGDITNPWRTLQRAFQIADAGDTVFFRDGVYYLDGPQFLNPQRTDALGGPVGHTGTRANPIIYMSYPGEWAIFDGSNNCEWGIAGNGNTFYNIAISIYYVEHVKFKDFEVRNVFQCDSVSDGAIVGLWSRYLTFEHIVLHNIGARGYSVHSGSWITFYDESLIIGNPHYGTIPSPYWETSDDTTRWINCDVYDLMDTLSEQPGNSADPFFTSTYDGNYFYWEGCRVWYYTDDGWNMDGINGGLRVVRNSWAMATDKYKGPYNGWTTERNGFKYGFGQLIYPETEYPDHPTIEITNSLVLFSSQAFLEITPNKGIIANNTVYRCNIGFTGGTSDFGGRYYYNTLRNNISWDPRTAWGGSVIPYWTAFYLDPDSVYKESHNTWDYTPNNEIFCELTDTVTVDYTDFVGLTGTFVTDSLYLDGLFRASRQADGSLPAIKPLTLKSTSDLIDAGTIIPASDNVDFQPAYYGTAPDIGYSEYSTVIPVYPFIINNQVIVNRGKTLIFR